MHTGYPSHAGMLRSLLGRSRTGEDEPALALPLVDRETDGIPQLRRHLPFVDEVRLGAFQEHRRAHFGQSDQRGTLVGILEVHSTLRLLLGRLGLAAPFRADDLNGAGSPKRPLKHSVGHARPIALLSLFVLLHHGAPLPSMIDRCAYYTTSAR